MVEEIPILENCPTVPKFDSVLPILQIDYIGPARLVGSEKIQPETTKYLQTCLDDIFDHLPKNLDTENTVNLLFGIIGEYDRSTAKHSYENAKVAEFLAKNCAITEPDRVQNLKAATLVHDIGKIGVLSILNTPPQGNRLIFDFRMLHAEFTRYILKKFPSLSEIEPIASSIHVKPAGKSYPPDIAYETVPYEAKILAVADALHSITHARPGDKPKSRKEALDILRANHYDKEIVKILEDILPLIPLSLIPNTNT